MSHPTCLHLPEGVHGTDNDKKNQKKKTQKTPFKKQ
jgi:hypothetical protein